MKVKLLKNIEIEDDILKKGDLLEVRKYYEPKRRSPTYICAFKTYRILLFEWEVEELEIKSENKEITHEEAIKGVESFLETLGFGYETRYDETEGTWDIHIFVEEPEE